MISRATSASSTTPALIVVGDEDERCIEPGLFLKDALPGSGLVVFPKTGHVVNLEEPDLFNQVVGDFLSRVDAGRWLPRDPRTRTPKIAGLVMEPGGTEIHYWDGYAIEEVPMLKWAFVFLIIAVIAGIFGFTDVEAASATIAQWLFGIFLVLFLGALIIGLTIGARLTS